MIQFSLAGGADQDRFTIDPLTGVLRFVTASDFETPADADGDNAYQVVVQVSDGSLTDRQALTITLTNVNEAPVIDDQAFSVNENAADGTVVGTVPSVDPDAGDAPSYAILDGNDSGAFWDDQ